MKTAIIFFPKLPADSGSTPPDLPLFGKIVLSWNSTGPFSTPSIKQKSESSITTPPQRLISALRKTNQKQVDPCKVAGTG
jgi:hypothetical protein